MIDDAAAVEFRSLRKEEFRCLCLSDHPLAGRDHVTWRELSSYAFLGWAKGTANRYAIDTSLESAGIELSPAFEVSQLGTMLGMVDMGLGVAAVPSLACPTSPRHASPRLLEPEVAREIGIAVLAGNPLTLAAEAFIGAVTDWLNPVVCC